MAKQLKIFKKVWFSFFLISIITLVLSFGLLMIVFPSIIRRFSSTNILELTALGWQVLDIFFYVLFVSLGLFFITSVLYITYKVLYKKNDSLSKSKNVSSHNEKNYIKNNSKFNPQLKPSNLTSKTPPLIVKKPSTEMKVHEPGLLRSSNKDLTSEEVKNPYSNIKKLEPSSSHISNKPKHF